MTLRFLRSLWKIITQRMTLFRCRVYRSRDVRTGRPTVPRAEGGAVIQFVSAPRRVPEERTARLAVAIGEVSPDLKPPGIVDAAGDEGGRLRARRIREHPAAAHAPAPPRSWGCRSRRSIVIVSSSVVHRTMCFQINPRNRRHKAHVQRKVCIRMQTDIHFQLSQHPIHPHVFKTLVERTFSV